MDVMMLGRTPIERQNSLGELGPLGNRPLETAAERKARLAYEHLGRNPNDQVGRELVYSTMIRRTAAVCCFIFFGGWLIKLGDDLYSWATGQPKGAATGHDNHEGLADFSSSYISSLLKASGQDLSSEDEEEICQTIIDRYYGRHKIFDTEGEELKIHARNLRNLQHRDISARDYRKVSGERLVFWIQLALAAFVSILAFTRGIVGDNENTQEEISIIGWIEGGAALATILIAQMVNKATIVDAEAAAVLRRIRKWGIEYTDNKLKLFSKSEPQKIEELMPIENALCALGYTTLQVKNLDNSILESVARLRTLSSKRTSTYEVQQQLNSFLQPRIELGASRAHINLEGELLPDPMTTIEKLSRLYDCPILIISETPFEDGTYCKIINQKAPPDSETKASEDDPQIYQAAREGRAMILYTSEPGFYRPVPTPKDIPSDAQRPFSTLVSELTVLQPSPKMPDKLPQDYYDTLRARF